MSLKKQESSDFEERQKSESHPLADVAGMAFSPGLGTAADELSWSADNRSFEDVDDSGRDMPMDLPPFGGLSDLAFAPDFPERSQSDFTHVASSPAFTGPSARLTSRLLSRDPGTGTPKMVSSKSSKSSKTKSLPSTSGVLSTVSTEADGDTAKPKLRAGVALPSQVSRSVTTMRLPMKGTSGVRVGMSMDVKSAVSSMTGTRTHDSTRDKVALAPSVKETRSSQDVGLSIESSGLLRRRREHRAILVGLCQENEYLWKVIRDRDKIIKKLKADIVAKDRVLEDYERRERDSLPIRRLTSMVTLPFLGHGSMSPRSPQPMDRMSSDGSGTGVSFASLAQAAAFLQSAPESSIGIGAGKPSRQLSSSSDRSVSSHISYNDSEFDETGDLLRRGESAKVHTQSKSVAESGGGVTKTSTSTKVGEESVTPKSSRSKPSAITLSPLGSGCFGAVPIMTSADLFEVRNARKWLSEKYVDFRPATQFGHRSDTHLFEASLGKVLIKSIPKTKPGCSSSDYAQEDPLMEMELTKKLSGISPVEHSGVQHFIRALDLMSDSKSFWIASPFFGGSDLYTFIKDNQRLHLDTVKLYASQMCNAVHFLHTVCGYVHLDVTPENYLIDAVSNEVKLIDFGAARRIPETPPPTKGKADDKDHDTGDDVEEEEDDDDEMRGIGSCKAMFPAPKRYTQPGKASYRSPELHHCKAFDGCKTDCWSLGVSLFTLLTGHRPWDSPDTCDEYFNKMYGDNPEEVGGKEEEVEAEVVTTDDMHIVGRLSGKMLAPKRPTVKSVLRSRNREYFTPLCVGLLNAMLVFDFRTRIDLEAVVTHKWFCTEEEPAAVAEESEDVSAASTLRDVSLTRTSTIETEELRGLDSSEDDEDEEAKCDEMFDFTSDKMPQQALEHLMRMGYSASPNVTGDGDEVGALSQHVLGDFELGSESSDGHLTPACD